MPNNEKGNQTSVLIRLDVLPRRKETMLLCVCLCVRHVHVRMHACVRRLEEIKTNFCNVIILMRSTVFT